MTVRAPAGRVTGTEVPGGMAYLGVPYAKAPLGPLRFRPPEPMPPQDIDATRPGPMPPQIRRPAPDWAPEGREGPYGEDCLNLDIHVPEGATNAPVIVHAFGGGFQGGGAGGGSIDGARFAARTGCILVRPNMRTGAFGFLHLADHFPELTQTNRGMLDLRAALLWVRDNIAAFGGDPERVTLTGMSSGAFTATALLPQAAGEGLVHRLWAMSGAASRIVLPETAAAIADGFLARTGAKTLNDLETLDVDTILHAQEQGLATDLGERNAPGGRTLGIVLDGTSLPRHPLDAIRAGAARQVAAVWSHTAEEARMWYAFGIMGPADDARLATTIRRFEGDDTPAALAELRAAHPEADPTRLEEIFLTDRIYARPARRTAEAQAAAGGLGASSCFGWRPAGERAALGAAHGFDEAFLFATQTPLMQGDPAAERLSGEMSGVLLALARDGDPGWRGHRDFTPA